MFQVIIHPQAKEDISRNATWWADHHSLEQAIAWVDTLEAQLQTLEENPERFDVAEENEQFSYEIRQMPVGVGSRRSHRAIYVMDDKLVHVLAVRRGDEDRLLPFQLPKQT